MNPKLSILICTIPGREHFLDRLKTKLYSIARPWDGIEMLYEPHPVDNIGAKRNRLLQQSCGDYLAFIDDDDMVSDTYFTHLFAGIEKGVDCCSLRGIITEDGANPLIFEHSIKYKEYKTQPDIPKYTTYERYSAEYSRWAQDNKTTVLRNGDLVKYERYPNHLNCIKASIAKQFKFPEINHGEDSAWAKQIFAFDLIKTEHYIDDIIYFYEHISKK